MDKSNLVDEFIGQCISILSENTPKVEKCVHELSEEDVWQRPNSSSNSVGNLLLHLCGNIRQYVISGIGGKEDIRQRDEEFATKGGLDKAELLSRLNTTVSQAINVLSRVNEQELLQIRSVQGNERSGMSIAIHVAEHYSYHTGQIAFWTKLLKDKDLGFYAGIDLNQKNK